ncbi:D-glycero-beta-D-manno-heptose 1-phosphate adenylyltransferase [Herbiconiux flava]|uniref:Bifunctional protein HldE n=1 Tax=Herbiconiux flava TaxID=881268 RepID=A0A852SSK6_9MICO|nr:D-glycero-beta-D-manno-heptose 1-phosphate adenylyltransferase [Herbiconiux flava]NYD71753.1 rfaE bifunctional protein kinase chain/domain/rfaE bifunctional protein nucleotidyltransferase chain/domain [Herbiconiux flava]GLK18283.1 bifunctional protein HldE [Herbiconiux flava]
MTAAAERGARVGAGVGAGAGVGHGVGPGLALAELPALIRARAPRVTVVGEVILDRWWRGPARRMSREAPVPVVDVDETRSCPGGAANTAVNLAALGARVRLVTVLGDDEAGRELALLLQQAGVDTSGLIEHPGATTTTKTRVVGSDQILVRSDRHAPLPTPEVLERFVAAVRAATDARSGAEAEIVCDYGTGLLGDRVRSALVGRDSRPALTVVDAHDIAAWAGLGADVVTPNAAEAVRALAAAGRRPESAEQLRALGDPDSDRLEAATALAAELFAASGAGAVVTTLDRDGAVLLQPGAPVHRTTARPSLEQQASGAGDTFAAALTLAVVCGAPLALATDLAQAAADIVVQQYGTSVCDSQELERSVARSSPELLDARGLVRALAADRAAGRRIVFTNGCFDVLHRGHTSYLRQAAQRGDVLVVALNDDDSVRRLKGEGRPVNPLADRAAVLAALGSVDHVVAFSEDTPAALLEAVHPDVYAKGGDYTPEMLEEAAIVRAYGGQVVMLDYVPEHSTTALVDRIRTGTGPAVPS